MNMTVEQEAQELWNTLQVSSERVLGIALPTRGLAGRASGKRFIPTEWRSDRLYLTIEGRDAPPKISPFITQKDFELYLSYERKEIDQIAAKKSFRTSYAGPLIELLRKLNR